jgi:hypothetical protein
MNFDYLHEIQTVHEVKVALCYLLAKIGFRIPEKELYGIVFNIEFINYFLYTAAMDELIVNDSVARVNIDGEDYIELHDKGAQAAEVLKKDVQFRFRKHLLEAAYNYVFEREVNAAVTVTTDKLPEPQKGYTVTAALNDGNFELMKLSLYAPDDDQAEYLSFQIRENPLEFYKTVLNTILMSRRPVIEIDESKV